MLCMCLRADTEMHLCLLVDTCNSRFYKISVILWNSSWACGDNEALWEQSTYFVLIQNIYTICCLFQSFNFAWEKNKYIVGWVGDTCESRKGNLFLSIRFLPAYELLFSFMPKQKYKRLVDKTMKGLKFVVILLWYHACGKWCCWFFSELICLCPDTVMEPMLSPHQHTVYGLDERFSQWEWNHAGSLLSCNLQQQLEAFLNEYNLNSLFMKRYRDFTKKRSGRVMVTTNTFPLLAPVCGRPEHYDVIFI